MMNKSITGLLKVLKWGLLSIVILLAGLFGLFHTSWLQNMLLQKSLAMLQEKLQTEVTAESVDISLFGQDVTLKGVTVKDRQDVDMFKLEQLGVDLDLWSLLNHEVKVKDARVRGLKANVYQVMPDSVPNFQFIVDAFKKDKDKQQVAKKKTDADTAQRLNLDVDQVRLERIKVRYDKHEAELGSLLFKKGKNGRMIAEIRELKTSWVQQTKKGPVDNHLRIGILDYMDMKDYRQAFIDSLCWVTDNHKPRKNSGRPKKGYFDVGHFNLVASMHLRVNHIAKDSLVAQISNLKASDPVSGIDLRNVKAYVEGNKRTLHLKDVSISLPNTKLSIARATMQLPSKKEGRHLAYSTPSVKGTTRLKDISRVFAPVLKGFNEPLQFQTSLTGDDNGMRFSNVQVNTLKKDLVVAASGYIRNLKDKYKLQVHFDINRMTAHGGSKERIINQFTVKKFMMKQLHNLGTIGYRGSFDVLWKREQFEGMLTTATGNLHFNLAIDENNKYLTGMVRTDSFELGKAMDFPGLKKVACKADFKFDISKPRTAIMRRKVGGKLPMGEIYAEVYEAKYKLLHVRNTVATIKSNGAIAEGQINVRGKRVDLLCSFSFTNTNEMQKTKIKPGIKFHGKNDSASVEKQMLKLEKKRLKAERDSLKSAAKAERKAQKKLERARRDSVEAVEKAARKAEKAAAKAAKKAEKAARKAAKKAEKEARKAARGD